MTTPSLSISELTDIFCAKAALVGTHIHHAANTDAALRIVLEICENKAPCELLIKEAKRTKRTIAAPSLDAETFAALAKACDEKNILCIKENARNYSAGIDIGLAMAELGIAASGTCMVASDSEEQRIATIICEYCILLLKKSAIYPDLPSIAPALRAQQAKGTPSYTSFVTGPSRTADIERIPAVGVHGALEQHVILLEN